MAESERLYEEVKIFFRHHAEWEFLIRMSEAPMETWELIPFLGLKKSYAIVRELIDSRNGYAAFYFCDGCFQYKYLDMNLLKEEVLKTGEIILFRDIKINEFNMKQVTLELQAFLKELQGS